MVSAVSSTVLVVVLARSLGVTDFGRYALAVSIAVTVGIVADLGIGRAAARFVAERSNEGEAIWPVVQVALRAKLVLSVLAFAGLFAVAGVVANLLGDPELAPPLRVAAIAYLLADLFVGVGWVCEAIRRNEWTAITVATRATGELAAVVVLLALGFGVIGALVGSAVGFAGGALAGVVLLRWRLRAAPTQAGAIGTSTVLRYAGHVWLGGVAWVGFERSDQILLGALEGSAAAGAYEAAWRVAGVLSLAGTAIAVAVGPRLARSTPEEGGALLTRSLRYGTMLYAPAACVFGVSATSVVDFLLGEAFSDTGRVLMYMVPYLLLVGIAPMFGLALNYLGAGAQTKWIVLVALAVNVSLDLVLIPAIGVVGPAIATDAAMVVFIVGHFRACHQRLALALASLRRTILVAIVAAACAAAASAAVQWASSGSGVLQPVATLAAGLAVAAAVYWAAREATFGVPPPRAVIFRRSA